MKTNTTLRPAAVATVFSLLLIGNLEAIDWDLRPVGRYVAGGTVRDLLIVGNHAYAVGEGSGPRGLRVFDLSNTTEPALVGHYDNGRQSRGVAVAGEYAYLVGGNRLEVFHLGNPGSPQWLGHSCVTTTYKYLTIDLEAKSAAIAKAQPIAKSIRRPRWRTDGDLLAWLESL